MFLLIALELSLLSISQASTSITTQVEWKDVTGQTRSIGVNASLYVNATANAPNGQTSVVTWFRTAKSGMEVITFSITRWLLSADAIYPAVYSGNSHMITFDPLGTESGTSSKIHSDFASTSCDAVLIRVDNGKANTTFELTYTDFCMLIPIDCPSTGIAQKSWTLFYLKIIFILF